MKKLIFLPQRYKLHLILPKNSKANHLKIQLIIGQVLWNYDDFSLITEYLL